MASLLAKPMLGSGLKLQRQAKLAPVVMPRVAPAAAVRVGAKVGAGWARPAISDLDCSLRRFAEPAGTLQGMGELAGRPLAPKPVEKKVLAPAPQAAAGDAPAPEPKKFLGFEPLTWAKILPLGAMFFCILFNYTILRDTKVRRGLISGRDRTDGLPDPRRTHLTVFLMHAQDVLVVTAPGSGAEIIPFLKTWVNLPMAIGFTIMYSAVSYSHHSGKTAANAHSRKIGM